jgi:hypothetical protein
MEATAYESKNVKNACSDNFFLYIPKSYAVALDTQVTKIHENKRWSTICDRYITENIR